MEIKGGVAAIVCDTTGNAVRQGYCYTCLAIGGYFGRVTTIVHRADTCLTKLLGGIHLGIYYRRGGEKIGLGN